MFFGVFTIYPLISYFLSDFALDALSMNIL